MNGDEVAQLVERRIAEFDRRVDANRNRISILEEDMRSMTNAVTKVHDDVVETKEIVKSIQLDKMNDEEKAAIRLMARQFVFQDDAAKVHAQNELANQRKWSRIFATMAALSPFITVILGLIVFKLTGIHP